MAAIRNDIDVTVQFTDAELADISIEMRDAVFSIQALEDEKKDWDAIQNGKIKEKKSLLEELAEKHRAGARVMPVPCELRINVAAGLREWIATGNHGPFVAGDIVSTEPLKPGDTQQTISFPAEEPDEFTYAGPSAEDVNDAWSAAAQAATASLDKEEAEVLGEADDAEKDAVAAADEDAEFDDADDPDAEELEPDMSLIGPGGPLALPDDDDNIFDDPGPEASPPDAQMVVTEKGMTIENVAPPKFNITPAHRDVLIAARDHKGTDILSFETGTRQVRAAAEHLISMGYVEGEDHTAIVGLTRKGKDLFKAGYVES